MSGFNLIREPWIPCLDRSWHPVRLGVRDLLRRSAELREISHASPLVTLSIHRFLLALVHRIHGPADDREWLRLWEARAWDGPKVEAYLERWVPRFELAEGPHRFYQSDYARDVDPTPISKLAIERASGNNRTLFDHTPVAQPMSLGEAAGYLLAAQAFAVGGTITPKPDVPASKYASDSHLTQGAVALVRGQNLFETLALNLCDYDVGRRRPYPMRESDRPAWEVDSGPPEERLPLGWLDLLTWQSRRILLHVSGPQVEAVTMLSGDRMPKSWQPHEAELMMAYRPHPHATGTMDPYLPLRISPGRALWRDSSSLLASTHGTAGLKMLRWLANRKEALETRRIFPIDMIGVAKDQAKILLWRHERLPLPGALLGETEASVAGREALRIGLEAAERAAGAVREAVRRLATALLSVAPGPPPREEARSVAASLFDEGEYWQRLEEPFTQFIYHLDDDGAGRDAALTEWVRQVRAAARTAFEGVVAGLGESVPALRASALVGPFFAYRLRSVGGEGR